MEFYSALPFIKIKSRLATAIILSYHGYREEVIQMLLCLNHISRAYIVNSDLLNGFLVEKGLREAIESPGFQEAVKW